MIFRNVLLVASKFVLLTISLPSQAQYSTAEINMSAREGNQGFFTENKGQISDQFYNPRPDVLFSGQAGGLAYYLRNDGVSYQLLRVDNREKQDSREGELKGFEVSDSITIYRLDINWLGINKESEIERIDAQTSYNNYYLAFCPEGATRVKSYSSVLYKNIYKAIDLKWYGINGILEYDYIISPGTDYRKIKWEVEGAHEISINDIGELIIRTEFGEIVEKAPMAYQENNRIDVKWNVQGNKIGFDINNYDKSKSLTIDPVVRVWGTYYGDDINDKAYSCALDQKSNVYITGYAGSSSSIATIGTHKSYKIGTTPDAFIAKFDSNGVRLWGTYYGGLDTDNGYSCVVDADSNIIMAGRTQSMTSIATPGSHQEIYGGGSWDAFLVKFNTSGLRIWGSYYGGTDNDDGNFCTVDSLKNIYMAGNTKSATAISSSGSHQTIYGGLIDAFIVKFNSAGQRQWSTYYGGVSEDESESCEVDGSLNVYLAGTTSSNTSIATSGSHQNNLNGFSDAFLAKFNSNGIRQWGTYYGGSQSDGGISCVVDGFNDVLLCGITDSDSMISTSGSHQFNLEGNDGFIAKFTENGVRKWGTYYGGSKTDYIWQCVVDQNSNIFIAGQADSDSAIATSSSHQSTLNGIRDAFLVKFSSNGIRQWGSYFGGQGFESGEGIAVYGTSSIYLCGHLFDSYTGISTPGGHQPNYGLNADGFLAKFKECNINTGVTQNGATLTSNDNNAKYQWLDCNSGYSIINGETSQSFTATSNGSYSVAITRNGCIDTTTCYIVSGIGIFENELDSWIKIYPNPNNGRFTLKSGKLINGEIKIYNFLGDIIYQDSFIDRKSVYINLPSDIVDGVYMVKVLSGKNSISEKILVRSEFY